MDTWPERCQDRHVLKFLNSTNAAKLCFIVIHIARKFKIVQIVLISAK